MSGEFTINAITVLMLAAPSVAIITTKNVFWRLALVILPTLMALNMKKQITSIDATLFSIPLVVLTVLSMLLFSTIDKKTAKAIENGEKKRTLIYYAIFATLFVMFSVMFAGMSSKPSMGSSSFGTPPTSF